MLIFTIAMHECESYTKRKQETKEVDAFEMGLLGHIMRITRNAVTSSQSKLLCWIKFLHHDHLTHWWQNRSYHILATQSEEMRKCAAYCYVN